LRSVYPGIACPRNADAIETSTNCCISGGVISCRVVGVLTRPMRTTKYGQVSYSIQPSRRMP
jgi:hypothetical protein